MAYVTILVLVCGLLMYLLSSNAKAQELGRLLFFAAALALLIVVFAPMSARVFH